MPNNTYVYKPGQKPEPPPKPKVRLTIKVEEEFVLDVEDFSHLFEYYDHDGDVLEGVKDADALFKKIKAQANQEYEGDVFSMLYSNDFFLQDGLDNVKHGEVTFVDA